MTIQEVIKSGKRFRRPSFVPNWYWVVKNGQLYCGEEGTESYIFGFEEDSKESNMDWICATDWEVEEDKKEFKQSTLKGLLRQTLVDQGFLTIEDRYGNRLDLDNFIDYTVAYLFRK